MRTYTQEDLDRLIKCEKIITTPPRKDMLLENGHYRNGMDLQSKDGTYKFSVYMRKNEKFEENFTIGLMYHPQDGTKRITLVRCNGPHGDHVNDFLGGEHHNKYHIHLAKDFNINVGKKSDIYAKTTNQYINLDEAILFFVKYCNISGSEKYFNTRCQLSLLDEGRNYE